MANIETAAAPNTVHWTVPQNLLKNPSTQAHLQNTDTHVNTHTAVSQSLLKKHSTHTNTTHRTDHFPREVCVCYLNMEETSSQVRDSNPIQTEGKVTVFRNWLNWWKVNTEEITSNNSQNNDYLLQLITDTRTHTPVLEETVHLSQLICRSNHVTVPKPIRAQTAISTTNPAHHNEEPDWSRDRTREYMSHPASSKTDRLSSMQVTYTVCMCQSVCTLVRVRSVFLA
jgi:hypothetical protein